MFTRNFRSGLLRLSAFAIMLAASAVTAAPVALVGGISDPYDDGWVPPGGNPPTLFTPADLAALTDGDVASGIEFSTHNGEHSTDPISTVGFQQRFDFDVSQYDFIEGIDFSWTGRYSVSDPIFEQVGQLLITAGEGRLYTYFNPTSRIDNELIDTFSVSFNQMPDEYDDVDTLLHDGVASIYLQTNIGFTLGNPLLAFHTLDSREVTANVRGTVKPVPEPGTLALLGVGLMVLVTMRRRSARA
jgi:hypothetical protein